MLHTHKSPRPQIHHSSDVEDKIEREMERIKQLEESLRQRGELAASAEGMVWDSRKHDHEP